MIVVGAGSSGCALAAHLAVNKKQVCLVEAGPDYGSFSQGRWPKELLDPKVGPDSHDWHYYEERAGGRKFPKSRAKVMGGCSAHNQCAAIWGLPEDYDSWGAEGWRYGEISEFIDRVERAPLGDSVRYRGTHGVVPTHPYGEDELAHWQHFFLRSAVGSGYPRINDLSEPAPAEGVASFYANVKAGIRWNSAFSFIDPVRNSPYLTILDRRLVDRLEINGKSASSIICISKTNRVETLKAKRFVLSAGTYGSPAILLRSGIGPKKELENLGIATVLDLAGVGKNLHDHPGIDAHYNPSRGGQEMLEEDLRHNTFFESQVILRAKSSRCEDNFDLHVLPYQTRTESGEWRFSIIAFDMTPLSRGSLSLYRKDPNSPPKIEPCLLTDDGDHDLSVLHDALLIARRMSQMEPLASMISGELKPGADVRSAEGIDSYIKENVTNYSHPVGTCKMGAALEEYSVVGASARVHGLGNVFVADASIIPRIPRANTNLTCYLIGLKIATLMLDES